MSITPSKTESERNRKPDSPVLNKEIEAIIKFPQKTEIQNEIELNELNVYPFQILNNSQQSTERYCSERKLKNSIPGEHICIIMSSKNLSQ